MPGFIASGTIKLFAVGEASKAGRRARQTAIKRYAPAAVLFVAGLAATTTGYRLAVRYERAAVASLFQRIAQRDRDYFGDVLDDQIHRLEAVLTFFKASQSVEKDEFATFAQSILSRSDLKAIEWAPLVEDTERSATEAKLGTAFTDWRPTGAPVPAGIRETYYPVFYLQPLNGNEATLGLDIASEPALNKTLERARDTGKLAVTGPLGVVQDRTSVDPYHLLVLPHYRPTASTLDERRQALAGFVIGLIQLQSVLGHAQRFGRDDDVAVWLTDNQRIVARNGSAAEPGGETSALELPAFDSPIEMDGWRIDFHAAASKRFAKAHTSSLPLFVLLAGSAFTLSSLLYQLWLTAVIARQRKTADELRRSQIRYRTAFEDAPEAIAIFDPKIMRIVDVNPAAEALLKVAHADCVGLGISDVSAPLQAGGRPAPEAAREAIAQAAAGAKPRIEWLVRDADGRDIECEVRLGVLPGEDGDLLRTSAVDISERRRAEERQKDLLRELDHRVKNCFATVLALADQTAGSVSGLDDFGTTFSGRVRALARAHEALAAHRWTGAQLREVAELVLAPYRAPDGERLRLSGEPMKLGTQAASALCMILHELATNAAKYGALSLIAGRVELSWNRRDDQALVIDWRESNGPSPGEIFASGFGTRLIRGLVEHELSGTLDVQRYPDGLSYRIVLPPEHVRSTDDSGEKRTLTQKDTVSAIDDGEVQP